MSDAFEAWIATHGYEDAVARELPPGPRTPRWPCVVTCASAPADLDPAFARQRLPGAALIKGRTVDELAAGAAAKLAGAKGRVVVHAFVPDPELYRSIAPQLAPLERAVRTALRLPAASAARAAERWGDGTTLVQLALVGRTSLLVSAAAPRALPRGGTDVAPWPAGAAPIPTDRGAPSRAYRKLEEALAWMGEAPADGQRCVDLGGAPGGWAWTALKRGAAVIAVDRSPLAPPAAGHPRLEVVLGNAFTYAPPGPVDWLLSDVICEPERTLELVEGWLTRRLCRRVVATIKFKGEDRYGILAGIPQRLAPHDLAFLRIKHLVNNKNEVELMAKVREERPSPIRRW